MIYASARFANADHTLVIGTDADGNTETVPVDHTVFRLPEHGPQGFIAAGGVIQDYVEPPPPEPAQSPIEKLAAFLAANPDVAALIG